LVRFLALLNAPRLALALVAQVALERAANLCLKQPGGVGEAARLYQRVANAHFQAFEPQRAADALCLGAKALAAAGNFEGCWALYKAACNAVYDGSEDVAQVPLKATAHETFEQAVEWCLSSSGGAIEPGSLFVEEAKILLPRLAAVARANGMEGPVNKVCAGMLRRFPPKKNDPLL